MLLKVPRLPHPQNQTAILWALRIGRCHIAASDVHRRAGLNTNMSVRAIVGYATCHSQPFKHVGSEDRTITSTDSRNEVDRFAKVPGLAYEIMLLAWRNRHLNAFILASTSHNDGDTSGTTAVMVPRSFWDEDPRNLDSFNEDAREYLR